MKNSPAKNIALIAILIIIVGSIFYLESQKARPGSPLPIATGVEECVPGPNGSCTTPLQTAVSGGNQSPTGQAPTLQISPEVLAAKEKKYERYVEITSPSGFINTDGKSLTIGELVGKKVVMVDFWTYSCINCQRTLPYLTNWYAKYKDAGLEIVSIHTPEFEFEKVRENVVKAAESFGVTYPIVQDNDFGTWRAYGNRYWPRKYLIDIDGFIVYDHIGEGAYAETEKKIQELLAERDQRLGTTNLTSNEIAVPETAETVDISKPRTPEIYFGAWRNELFGNGIRFTQGEQNLSLPAMLSQNVFYFDGVWDIEREYAENAAAGARIILPYQAQRVFIVARADTPVRVKILIDGKDIPASMRGRDVDKNGYVTIQEDRLYRLVEDSIWGKHTIEIKIESPKLQ